MLALRRGPRLVTLRGLSSKMPAVPSNSSLDKITHTGQVGYLLHIKG